MKLADKALITASEHFLTEPIPKNYAEMKDEEFYDFLKDHAWEPFEYWRGEDIFKEIDSLADTLIKFLKANKTTLKP